MEVNVDNMVLALIGKIEIEKFSSNTANAEKCLLEFKTELYMKRDEVKQTNIDLELSNNEISELKKELDKINKECEETQFSLNIFTKKSKSIEEELNAKRDNFLKIQIQYKMATSELDALKEKFRITETERNDLIRKIDFFESKQKHTSTYDGEIFRRENSLKNAIEEINTTVTILKQDQQKICESENMLQLAVESMTKLNSIQKSYDDLKKEKDKIEELYVLTEAKLRSLEEYKSTSNQIIHHPNLMTKTLFNLWKLDELNYKKYLKEKNEMMSNICQDYEEVKCSNVEMIVENEKLRGRIEELGRSNQSLKIKIEELDESVKKTQIAEEEDDLFPSNEDQPKIKSEVIEIDDDY